MIIYHDFGKREKPCGDCDERDHCTMNCGPPVIDSKKLAEAAKKAAGSVRREGGGRSA